MTCNPEQINLLIYLAAGAITANALSLFLILFTMFKRTTNRDLEMLMFWFECFKELKDIEKEMENKKK